MPAGTRMILTLLDVVCASVQPTVFGTTCLMIWFMSLSKALGFVALKNGDHILDQVLSFGARNK